MKLITAIEISSNYPENILITASQYKDTGKWVSQMYLMRDGEIHKMMLSFDRKDEFEGWDTEKEAKDKMEDVAQSAISYIKDK